MENHQEIALVTVDGHSIRLQSSIWEEMKNQGIIVMRKSSHTSNITFALDCETNRRFKNFNGGSSTLSQEKRNQ
jgi:hypothetical protein